MTNTAVFSGPVKKIILIFTLVVTLTALGFGVSLVVILKSTEKPGPLPETSIILIERGKGVSAIGKILEDSGVVSSALVFKIIAALDKDKRPLKAGEYEFTARMSLRDALKMMREGKIYDRKVTIPEGMTSWQIVETLKSLPDMQGEILEVPGEGTLLPETYHYIKNQNRAEILLQMSAAMGKVMGDLWPTRVDGLPIQSPLEAMILASIVEKETGVAHERARIAGVFINRLRRGIPLQSDPTVIYVMTKGEIQNAGQGPIGRRLLTKDLGIDSPYNTYLYSGLPPGPIANPGKAAIEAVLRPEVHDYLYFVADGTGGHVFARTLEEHNRNVAHWRKIRQGKPNPSP